MYLPVNNQMKLGAGILTTFLVAIIAGELSTYIGVNLLGYKKSPVSAVIIAIIIGMIIGNLINIPKEISKGFEFSAKLILRLGIILLGIRLSMGGIYKKGKVF